MKIRLKPILAYITLSVIISNCTSQRMSTMVGGEYNEIKNETEYFVMPYGKVTIPGKWIKSNYNSVSRQQFFQNSDSVIIAIAFNRFNDYEFNMEGEYNGFDFVKKFYKWDSQYFINTYGFQSEEMKIDSTNGFMIYKIFGQIENEEYKTYFLIGEKNGNISNYSISNADKWTKNEKLTFLENLFMAEKE